MALQPVDEAVQMVQDYYIYIIAFVVVLIFLAAFYYSKQIAKPLLKINDTTKKIAHLDFTEQIPITQKMKLVIYRKILMCYRINSIRILDS